MRPFVLLLALPLLLAACGDDDADGAPRPAPVHELVEAFGGQAFSLPVGLETDGSGRFFVVEQAGRIRVVRPGTPPAVATFLDIRSQVESGGEMGLLGLAFPADHADSGRFFVYYTARIDGQIRSRLCRFEVGADPDLADPGSEVLLLEVVQPYSNHNGGGLAFGPDGMLYLGLGDGGGGGDNEDNGQDRSTLLGAILRLDVSEGADAPPHHTVPADNPFVGNAEGWREEIWAFGLRNPWRISFDPQTGGLWTGDVGQNLWEEIDRVEKGGNHGWDCREGTHPYTGPPDAPSPACAGAGPFVEPVFEYPHEDGNLSITGGYVYRGSTLVDLRGRYVYADYVSGRVWAVDTDGSDNTLLVDADFSISSFGRDAQGELYAVEYGPSGGIWKLVEAGD